MTSKHYKWQTRWRIESGLATHDTGLRVRLVEEAPMMENADEVAATLAPKHGPHNVPVMLQRMLREAGLLLGGSHGRH